MIDIDHFKQVNDMYGHVNGDIVLQMCVNVFRGAVRQLDIVARYGGEEFVVLLLDCSHSGALGIAERIRDAVEQKQIGILDQQTVHITVSIGVATYLETTEQPENLIQEADKALYTAKQSGRNQVCSAKVS